MTVAAALAPAYARYCQQLGDDRLILGHRVSEWCGHAPILEEDIALANIALDLIGQATFLLGRAGAVENAGRDADALAFLRDDRAFRNALMVELPNGDFAVTIVRQFFFASFSRLQLEALTRSPDTEMAGIAAKALKEATYHVRHAAEWVVRLGDGTEESRQRAQDAVNDLWRYTGEFFLTTSEERALAAEGLAVDPATLQAEWERSVRDVLTLATLTTPATSWMQRGGRDGKHTEHLGPLLAEMQVLPRSHPGASW
ncbi:MAG: phenylacetate-CoA oxygenase subunit PaaC [Gemmatimonadaceae bacterium]|nr:phenylacetate-CoA oxygenase subunit PaaC [Gemmatimonadaceae bacterium]